ILAKSNTQGLDAEYFETRLKQWEEVIPWYTGWFLGPADVRWLRDKSTNLLKEITAGKSALGISSDLNYQDETQLFCISTYCGCENSHHFLDCQVQNELGKMFYVTIIGFLIAPDVMAAVVKLTPGQVKISEIGKDFLRDEASLDILSHAVRSVSVGSSNNEGSNVVNATNQSVSTAHSEKQEGNMAVENVSYVVVKRSRTATFPYITNTDAFNRAMYSEVAEEGFIPSHKFSRLEDVGVCQIRKDVWLVFPPEKYTLQSVFTGYF
ncbi:uncharacterized protein LOC111617018, partial [Centruroides sculpturatus]|uniref:uncharacterized protein LOC111617018 n=1 Tax=Centruroides sculpturatus TaxID=218467 RepID=UPI000C6DAD6E